MFDKELFCSRLYQLRTAVGQTQGQVADAVGARKQYVSRWEKGIQEPTIATLVALADIFNVSIDYLVGRTDNPKGGIE